MRVRGYVYVCVYISIYMYTCVYVCVHTSICTLGVHFFFCSGHVQLPTKTIRSYYNLRRETRASGFSYIFKFLQLLKLF